ncbi:TFIIH basal transcription factor complex TTD-A subunit [Nematocida displodere]|uniref:General transcription and DNA repair factor IIH subunit TFB5 n=1 Tax=Nematocida displodere TaxID=1805483 RepID=A0A177EIZ2_9MICR|nr:TFIIH basal transcription factor complex TTD-A subunit [Nematocida displodere]
MVKAIRGVLLHCDPSVKEIIIRLNREHNFIILDINMTTLFVDKEYLNKIEEETEAMLNHIVKKNLE